jgi:hypothetical protein
VLPRSRRSSSFFSSRSPSFSPATCETHRAPAGRAGLKIPHAPGGYRSAALVPSVIVMFWFAYGLMNRTIDRWFSRPVEEVREDTARWLRCSQPMHSRMRRRKRL